MAEIGIIDETVEYPLIRDKDRMTWKGIEEGSIFGTTTGGTWEDIKKLEAKDEPETVGTRETIELSETLSVRFTLDGRDILVTDLISLGRALRKTHADPDITAFVERDPFKLHGAPILKGTRIPVGYVLGVLADSFDISKIRKHYPDLTEQQVEGAIYFAVEMCDL